MRNTRSLPIIMMMMIVMAGCSTFGQPRDGAGAPLVSVRPTVPPALAGEYPGGDRELMLPQGFAVSVFAAGLRGPRHMAQGPDGAIYVAEKGASRVSRLPDTNADGVADEVQPYALDLQIAHSLIWHEGKLYVGATDGIYQVAQPSSPTALPAATHKLLELPAMGQHSTRTVRFGPDGKMYVAVGSTCNVCEESDPRRAAIWVYNADGTGGSRFASGLRNTVDFAFHPETGAIYGVDNGRDLLGDDLPPEELNLIQAGKDYGWPRCHGGDIPDPEFGKVNGCAGTEPPVVKIQAHSAPLGILFYTDREFPEAYRGAAFISFHGSWNRARPTGYKVVMIPFQNGKPAGPPQDFLSGWLTGTRSWGRPVGLLQTADGALLVSDDTYGVIYRVTYTGR